MKPLELRKRRHQKVGAAGDRISIRLRPRQALRIRRMGRVEHRSFAEYYRAWMDRALDDWEVKHPAITTKLRHL